LAYHTGYWLATLLSTSFSICPDYVSLAAAPHSLPAPETPSFARKNRLLTQISAPFVHQSLPLIDKVSVANQYTFIFHTTTVLIMKTIFRYLPSALLCFLLLWVTACKKDDAPAVTPNICKLSTIDRGNGNKHSYTYDALGRITQMAREFDGTGSGTISRYVYVFTFDGAGLLTKSIITLDGKPYGTETYIYTNGRISKATYVNVDGSKGSNSITYNAAGQITEFTYETGDPNSDAKQYFAYNADGLLTESGYSDLPGTSTFFKITYTPVGKVTSPEQLLATHGLPYDVLTGTSWSVALGGEGSTDEVFFLDDKTNKFVSGGKDKTTVVKTNTKGYLTQIITIDDANQRSTQTFTLTDCN